jgi:hypothetical protein
MKFKILIKEVRTFKANLMTIPFHCQVQMNTTNGLSTVMEE